MISRREFAKFSTVAASALVGQKFWPLSRLAQTPLIFPLMEFRYGDVSVVSPFHAAQLDDTYQVLMSLNEDSLLKPFRQMAGQPAPGPELGGWYNYNPDYDWHKDDAGFAPAATFGQWISALARCYAITGSNEIRQKVLGLNQLYAKTISGDFYDKNRFPAYCFDKLVVGLIDSHKYASDPDAWAILESTTKAAVPHLPGRAIDHDVVWRPGKDESYTWDESYTIPENLFLAYQRGAGDQYRQLAIQYLNDSSWFNPLARGENVLSGKHAYSYVNSLSSAMQAYLTLGSEQHLRAAQNAFAMLSAQSFATGGWGPDESLRPPTGDDIYQSLSNTHNSFETPCGSYAHFKITRYLLRVTRDPYYGDSMERVMYNTVLGARPMHADGRAFYYQDCNFSGKKVYSTHRFPCCSGTLPQVAADYGINSYFHDNRGIFVNLYLASRVRWPYDGAMVEIKQGGDYPFGDTVHFELTTSQTKEFALNLRIPQWAESARIEVNGKRWPEAPVPGRIRTISRPWRSGDRVDLELPRRLRLEAVDPGHPDVVALLCGPLVLFPITENGAQLSLTRAQLLASKQTQPEAWETSIASGTVRFKPYVALDDETYSTYLRVS